MLSISEPFLPPKICFELYKFGVTAVRNLGQQKQIMPRPIESGVSFPISGRSQRACQMDATMPKVMPKAKARLLTKGKIKTKTMPAYPVSSCVDTSDLCLLRWLWNQHMCVYKYNHDAMLDIENLTVEVNHVGLVLCPNSGTQFWPRGIAFF